MISWYKLLLTGVRGSLKIFSQKPIIEINALIPDGFPSLNKRSINIFTFLNLTFASFILFSFTNAKIL